MKPTAVKVLKNTGNGTVNLIVSSDNPIQISIHPVQSNASSLAKDNQDKPVLKRLGNSSRTISSSVPDPVPMTQRTVEEKRLLIRKQLVVLLHSIVCRRRDLNNSSRGETLTQSRNAVCNVPYCGLMKTVLVHLNSCKSGRTCEASHCPSSRQILIHWKYCVKVECPVCVPLRRVLPSSLLTIFPNSLCRAEIMQRHAAEQENSVSQILPELMQSEE